MFMLLYFISILQEDDKFDVSENENENETLNFRIKVKINLIKFDVEYNELVK